MRNRTILAVMSLCVAPALSACGKKAAVKPTPPAAQASKALPDQPGPALAAPVATLERVQFAFDRSDLDADARRILTAGAAILRENPDWSVRVEGHADDSGSTQYNLALSERRASAVVSFLVDLGIDGRRLQTTALGEERPLDAAGTREAAARNRRAELVPTGRGPGVASGK